MWKVTLRATSGGESTPCTNGRPSGSASYSLPAASPMPRRPRRPARNVLSVTSGFAVLQAIRGRVRRAGVADEVGAGRLAGREARPVRAVQAQPVDTERAPAIAVSTAGSTVAARPARGTVTDRRSPTWCRSRDGRTCSSLARARAGPAHSVRAEFWGRAPGGRLCILSADSGGCRNPAKRHFAPFPGRLGARLQILVLSTEVRILPREPVHSAVRAPGGLVPFRGTAGKLTLSSG